MESQVRLVFDAPPTPAIRSAKEATQEDASEEEDEDGEEGEDGAVMNGRAKRGSGKGEKGDGRAAAVVAMLQQVSEEQVEEISAVCRCIPSCFLHYIAG